MDPSIISLFFFFQLIATSFASGNVRQVKDGVQLLKPGHFSFDLKDKFVLEVLRGPCDEPIELCYPAKAIIDEYGTFYVNSNFAKRCASKDCAITITDGQGTVGGQTEMLDGNFVFTFDDNSKELCPRKTNGTIQSFTVTQLPPGCLLVVKDVSLSTKGKGENEDSGSPWLGILAGIGVVTLFGVLVAIGTFFLYKYTIKRPVQMPTLSKKKSNPQGTQPSPSTTPSPIKTSPVPSSIAPPTDPKV